MPESLYLLALLACPVGMGAMMWMMSRKSQAPADGVAQEPAGGVAAKQAELARLQSEIDELRGQPSQVGGGTEMARPVR